MRKKSVNPNIAGVNGAIIVNGHPFFIMSHVVEFMLFFNEIEAVCKEVVKCPNIRSVIFNKTETTQLIGLEDGSPGIVHIANMISSSIYIASLTLIHTRIGDACAKTFADGILKNNTLRSLHISNSISQVGILHLCPALKAHAFLTALILCYNRLDDKAIEGICDAITGNKNIKHLDLSYTHMSDIGLMRLSDALLKSSISSLMIAGNNFTDNVVQNFAVKLRDQQTLYAIDIANHPRLSAVTEKMIEDAIFDNGYIILANYDNMSIEMKFKLAYRSGVIKEAINCILEDDNDIKKEVVCIIKNMCKNEVLFKVATGENLSDLPKLPQKLGL